MHEKVCYKKPYLKEVIFRLDFGSRIEAFIRALPPKIAKAALQVFPLFEPQKEKRQEIKVSPNTFQTKTEDSMKWIYHGRNREKTLAITAESFIITNRKYQSFEAFRADFHHVLNALFEECKDLSVARVGLRYVNILDIPGDDPLAWSDYVNEEMLGIIDMHKDAQALIRVFHIVEFNYDGQHVKFQFGIANPDYPASIKRKQFVLDIDSSFTGALAQDDISRCVDSAHEKIQELFEESVTSRTRTLMEPSA